MKYFYKLVLFSLLIIISSCTAFETTNSYQDDFFPLAVGNKWYYSIHSLDQRDTEVTKIVEVITKNIIQGKEYFVLKNQIISEGTIGDVSEYYRISNDTLFSLTYDLYFNKYFESIAAIFTLNINEKVHILPAEEIIARHKKEGMPYGFKIETIKKDHEIIEFKIRSGAIDSGSKITYKKGVGIIKSINDFGVGFELIKYELEE